MNPIAIITGGSKGIGLEIAKKLSYSGYNCVLISRSNLSLQNALNCLNKEGTHIIHEGDVKQSDLWDIKNKKNNRSVWNLIKNNSILKHSPIKLLINAAGISQNPNLLPKTSEQHINDLLDTNLLGTILASRSFLKYLALSKIRDRLTTKNNANINHTENKNNNIMKSNCIINISSVLALRGLKGSAVYAATKAGIVGFTKALSKESILFSSTRVNAVCPGMIKTNMLDTLSNQTIEEYTDSTSINRLGTPEEIADAVCFLINNEYCNGTILTVDGGFTA